MAHFSLLAIKLSGWDMIQHNHNTPQISLSFKILQGA